MYVYIYIYIAIFVYIYICNMNIYGPIFQAYVGGYTPTMGSMVLTYLHWIGS